MLKQMRSVTKEGTVQTTPASLQNAQGKIADLVDLTEALAKAAFIEIGEAIGQLYKEMLLDRLVDVSGGEDRIQGKLALYLEARDMTIENFIEQYRKHIIVYVADDAITVAADSPEWDVLAQVLEYGTRLSPPMPHWMSSARDFYRMNKAQVDAILQDGLESAKRKILK